MRCPFCGYEESKVVDSRPTDDGEAIRRRRECMKCEKRFTTYENVETIPIMVLKKNNTHELFNREKIMSGLIRACEKTSVSIDQMEAIIAGIEAAIQNSMEREITTSKIGEMVMQRLRALDEVAYIRFVSVYRSFKDIDTFLEELNKLRPVKDES